MGNLAELNLHTSYHKGRDNIAESFYLPCMRRANEYDRAVGFFRSTIFIIAWPALRDFVLGGGRMRVLCSHVLSSDDADALDSGYSARVDEVLSNHYLAEVRSLLSEELLEEPAQLLAALVAQGTIELQIAVMTDSQRRSVDARIFHDKLGIFRDMDGNVVVFKGSMNETWTGLAADGNLESVDVAATWMGARDTDRARNEEAYFADLWADQYPTLKVRPFPEVARAELSLAAPDDWGSLLERLSEFSGSETMSQDARGRVLLPHQAAGLASWFANDRRGVLAFATGSGKTFTAITAIREALSKRNEIVLVMVPDLALFSQWLAELKEVANDLGAEILRAGAGGVRWKENLHLWTQPGSRRKIVLATLKTAASSEFRNQLPRDARLMLVADEVHRLGSPFHQSLLNSDIFGARLGLSATPERAGDPAGTGAVLAFFGGILEPRYTLADAIRDQVLVPYFYRPHTVEMSPSEAEQWSEMSKTIRRLQARQKDGKQLEPLNQRLKLLLIRRASIVKHAQAKIQLAINVLRQEFQPGQRWIVYCENLAQLDLVSGALEASGFPNMPYHSKMEGDRTETLKWLDRRGGIVVAIKCLDEGVDIPSVTHALILASSRNPREFVQRRGRVLRKAPNKSLAYVHDAIVLPPASEDNAEVGSDPLTAGELARAVHFALDADNPASAADLQNIAIDLGLNWQALLEVGTEDDV